MLSPGLGLSESYCVPFDSEGVGGLAGRFVLDRGAVSRGGNCPVGFFGAVLVLTVGVFCPSVSLKSFGRMKSRDNNKHKNRKIMERCNEYLNFFL